MNLIIENIMDKLINELTDSCDTMFLIARRGDNITVAMNTKLGKTEEGQADILATLGITFQNNATLRQLVEIAISTSDLVHNQQTNSEAIN